jgi:hypothetical protein
VRAQRQIPVTYALLEKIIGRDVWRGKLTKLGFPTSFRASQRNGFSKL